MSTEAGRAAEAQATAIYDFSIHAQDWLDNPQRWNYKDMRFMATALVQDPKEYKDILELIDAWQEAGVNPAGGREDLYELQGKTFSSHKLQKEFARRCWYGFQRLMNDAPQGNAAYIRALRPRTKHISYRFYEDGTSLFTRGHGSGRTIVVIGPRGSGKTYTSYAYIGPDCLQRGMYLVGNVPATVAEQDLHDDRGVPVYYYSELLSETLRFICERRLEDSYTCRLYDEMGVVRKKARAAADTYQTEKDLFLLERKLWSMTVAITQLETDVPNELRGLTDLTLRKPSPLKEELHQANISHGARAVREEYFVGCKGPHERYAELSEMGIPYLELPTYALGMFAVDINYKDLWQYLTKELRIKMNMEGLRQGIDKAQVKLIIEYIDSMERKGTEPTNLERGRVYREIMKENHMTVRSLAELIGRPKSTVNDCIRALEKYESGRDDRKV